MNGDVQRGKSTVEAFKALVVKLINDSGACRDTCFTLLGTQMLPWAADVANKMERAAAPAAARGGAEADGGAAEDAAAVALRDPWFLVTPICAPRGTSQREHEAALQRTMVEGGCIVFSRTRARMDKAARLVFEFTHAQHVARAPVSAHFVVLDEADRMRGTGAEGEYAFEYEQSLAALCGGIALGAGLLPAAPPPREHRRMRPAMVSDVSATNGLCFFAMLARLGADGHKVMDVLSFEDDPLGYIGFSQCEAHRGRLLEGLSKGGLYVNDAVLDIYHEVLTTDWACLLDCTTTAVNAGTAANQQARISALACIVVGVLPCRF